MRHVFTAIAAVSALALVTTATPAQAKTKKVTKTTTETSTTTIQQTSAPDVVRNDVDVPETRPMSATDGPAFKVGFDGFADIQAKVPNRRTVGDRGFSINDGALMMRANYRYAEGVVDLPFYTNGTGTATGAGASNSFNFATEQAQAYLNFHNFSSMPMFVRAGQYDSFFGLEANDSRDRFFTDKGLIKHMLPWTSTGALAGWSHGGMTLQAQVANGPQINTAPSQWTSSSGTMTANAPSYALNAKMEHGMTMASLSLLMDHTSGFREGAISGSPDGYLVDAIIGCKHERMNSGIEAVYRKYPGTPGATAGSVAGAKPGYNDSWGVNLLSSYHLSDALSAGIRFEWARDPVLFAGAQTGDIFQGSIGPVWQLEKNLALRGDATAGHIAKGNATVPTGMLYSFTVSAVASLF